MEAVERSEKSKPRLRQVFLDIISEPNMDQEDSPYLFISYRRADTQWIARSLHRYLSEGFGEHRVFMDRVEIRGGDQWRTSIDNALHRATVVLAIIGRQWLTLKNDYGRPRIDEPDDWVHTEIRTALNHRKKLIPLYVDGADLITDAKFLPPDIKGLIDSQGIVLTESYWDAGLLELLRRLRAFGFESHQSSIPMPERRKKVEPLTSQALEQELRRLPGWRTTTSYALLGDGGAPQPRTELYKEFRFNSFREATSFMAYSSEAIDKGNHHPRWENVWTTVRVWLSTWDIEFQPSSYDLRLANTLESEYQAFKEKSKEYPES